MSIVSTTLCYPNPTAPTQGIFVRRRLDAIARLMPVTVISPVPWFPRMRPIRFDPACGLKEVPAVRYPRMFYLPGIAKSLDAAFYDRALRAEVIRLRHQMPVRLIDAHFEWPDGVGAFRSTRKLGIPFVCTLRGKLVSRLKHRAIRRQIVEMLRGADALIAVSKSLAELAGDAAGQNLPIRVIPNGVDRSTFRRFEEKQSCESPSQEARTALGWSADARYAVSVGHLQSLKGFARLIELWPQIRRRVGDVRLVLVGGPAGEPDYEYRLQRLVRDFRLGELVTFAGRIEPQQVAQMLNAANLFVLASRSEGWCNALAEALACGCPAVASDVGGNREIVTDSKLGRLVALEDHDRWIEEIAAALQRSWDRDWIAEKGGRRDWQQVAAECVDVFKGILGD